MISKCIRNLNIKVNTQKKTGSLKEHIGKLFSNVRTGIILLNILQNTEKKILYRDPYII